MSDQTEPTEQQKALMPSRIREGMTQGGQPMAIIPRTFLEVQSMAQALAASGLVPKLYQDHPADVLLVIQAGLELGIPPVQSMRLHHVIEGVPRLSADGIASVVMSKPVCEYLECVETTAERCTWRTKRPGRPEQTRTWTKERSVRAGLWDRRNRDGSPGNWQKYPERMLSARAKSELCRDVYPDIAAGLYSAEEAWDGAIDAEFTEVRNSTAAFSAPTPPTQMASPRQESTPTVTLDPSTGAQATQAKRSPTKPKPGPIDVPSEERPTQPTAASSPAAGTQGATPSTNISSSAPTPTPTPTPTPASPAALSSAPSTSAAPPANTNGQGSTSTASASTPPDSSSSSPASGQDVPPPGDDDSGFGGEDPTDTPPARSMATFRAAISAVKPGPSAAADLAKVKAEWVPWSMIDGPDGGKAHAREMREIFARARAELGV